MSWSSAGSVLAAGGGGGGIVLWGVDKDCGKGDRYCSVSVNSEAMAAGGHFTGKWWVVVCWVVVVGGGLLL